MFQEPTLEPASLKSKAASGIKTAIKNGLSSAAKTPPVKNPTPKVVVKSGMTSATESQVAETPDPPKVAVKNPQGLPPEMPNPFDMKDYPWNKPETDQDKKLEEAKKAD